MNKSKQAEQPIGKIRYSITHKLNSKLFFRLLRAYMALNVIILIITCVCLTIYCERRVLDVVNTMPEMLEREGARLDEAGEIHLSGVRVREVQSGGGGYIADWPLSRLLPYETERAYRGFSSPGGRFYTAVGGISYTVTVASGGKLYEISQSIGPFVLVFIYAFSALHVYELLALFSRSYKDRRMVRRTLDPISELARATQSLNNVTFNLDHDKMAAMAGKLEGIDAHRLDTRIQVDDLQEELRNLAVAINGMLDRINESYVAQARFVSDASHELRTPISVIQGYANLLDRWGKNDEKTLTESISAIKDEADNMKDLVEQLLFLARGESNTIALDKELLSLSELIDDVVSETKMLDSKHEFAVKYDDVAVFADKGLIKQTLRILVDNAMKYTDFGGEITISARRDGELARLAVSDTGIGISAEVLPYVFDRFVRADDSRARATGGAGLGLSIAQWIAARHGGHMEVLSREGIGTRITVALPIEMAENKEKLPESI